MSVCCRNVNWQARVHRRETHLLRLDKSEELGLDGGPEDGALSVLNTMLEAANGEREMKQILQENDGGIGLPGKRGRQGGGSRLQSIR